MDKIDNKKFYTGTIKMCNEYDSNNIENSINNSTDYMKDAFLYKVDDCNYMLIEDGPDSDITTLICLVPAESLYGRSDLYPNKPRSPFDMFVDENTLELYNVIKNNDKKVK